MFRFVWGFGSNPLLLGAGLLLLGVVLGYGDRGAEDSDEPILLVPMELEDFRVPAEVQWLSDLEYARPNGQPLSLDLYRPEEFVGELPVIIWIHGDGWRVGDRRSPRAAVEFVARGYAVASIDYRLSDAALFPAQIDDCRAAVQWLRAHAEDYQLDASRFVAWGNGAGGHLAALLGTMSTSPDDESARVQAVVDIGGPIDFLTLDEQATGKAAIRHADPWSPESLLVGGPIAERAELVALTSPLAYLTEDRRPPPFLVIHSRHDPMVPVRQSELLVRELREAGGSVQFLQLKGFHNPTVLSRDIETAIADFLERRLRPTDTTPERRTGRGPRKSYRTGSERPA